jgi:tetratricopeptide (TPR) repeat protein
MRQKTLFTLVFVLCVLPDSLYPQNRLQNGLKLYGAGFFAEAAAEFRAIESSSAEYHESLYWAALAEMSRGNYRESLSFFETLERDDPANRHAGEIPYHKGRLYFYLGRYDEAIITLSGYSETQSDNMRRAAAMYWAGESLYAMGQLDKAETVFSGIIERYPASVKRDAALYRMELIKQKKVEAELLSLLKWNREESLKTLEEYRRRETVYDQTLAAYQKRLTELEGIPAAAETAAVDAPVVDAVTEVPGGNSLDRDTVMLLLSLKNDVLNLSTVITERLERETW